MLLQVTSNKALAVLIYSYVLIFTVSFKFPHSSSIHHPNLKVLNQTTQIVNAASVIKIETDDYPFFCVLFCCWDWSDFV